MQNLTLDGTTELTTEEAIQTHGGDIWTQIIDPIINWRQILAPHVG